MRGILVQGIASMGDLRYQQTDMKIARTGDTWGMKQQAGGMAEHSTGDCQYQQRQKRHSVQANHIRNAATDSTGGDNPYGNAEQL